MSDAQRGTAETPSNGPRAAAHDGNAIEVRGVRKTFGGLTALADVDLDVPAGQISALIGPNGAGKSTLFNVITGHLEPDSGSVRMMGDEVTGRPMWDLARRGIGRTFQTPRGFSSMTVLENLMVSSPERRETLTGAFLPSGSVTREVRKRAYEVLDRIGLTALAERHYDELSAGQLHVLEVGRQLMRDISVVLLDEPTAGVIPSAQDKLGALLADLGSTGITVLVVEHNLKFVFSLAETVAVMTTGSIICCDTPAAVQRDQRVIDAYLGTPDDA